MSTKNKLIIAAVLLAVGSAVMGAGSTPASAQSFGNSTAYATGRAYQTNDAYRGNVGQKTHEIQKFGRVGP
jgi:hypothetical protein